MTKKIKDSFLNYNKETEAAIKEAREILIGKRKTKIYESVEELFEDLENEE